MSDKVKVRQQGLCIMFETGDAVLFAVRNERDLTLRRGLSKLSDGVADLLVAYATDYAHRHNLTLLQG